MKSIHVKMAATLVLTATLTGYGQESRTRTDQEQNSRTNKWQVQAGWVHQFGRGMSVSGPAPSLSLGYRSLGSGVGLTYPDNGALIPRNFNDGYVRPDIWTGDADLLSGPNPERYNMTWNWGANNARQYNADGGANPTLRYHINRGEYAEKVYDIECGKSDDDDSNGVEIKARRLLHSWTDSRGMTNEANAKTVLELNLVVGLAWFPETTQRSRCAVGQNLYEVTETYTYLDYYGSSAGGSWCDLELPYSGTYGSATDAGSLIPVTPVSSSLHSTYRGRFVDSVVIKSEMWHLRGAAGVELVKPITKRLTLYVTPQAVLELVDMNAERTETVTFTDGASGATTPLASNKNKKHKLAVVPGILLTAGVDYRFSENWYAGASLGWEELAFDPSVRVGAGKVKYDLSGGEFNLNLGRYF